MFGELINNNNNNIERLIPRATSLTVDCRGVNISLIKAI